MATIQETIIHESRSMNREIVLPATSVEKAELPKTQKQSRNSRKIETIFSYFSVL